MIWVLLQSESPWQHNDAITFFIYLCVSLYQELLLSVAAFNCGKEKPYYSEFLFTMHTRGFLSRATVFFNVVGG